MKGKKGALHCRVGLILLTMILALSMFPVLVFAKEKKTVKIGVYPLTGFHSFQSDGTCVGYDVDYLTKIAGYTGWNYQYVQADSWGNAIDMLRSGEIDLLSPSQITTDRLNEFGFSTFPIGKVYAAILAKKSSSVIYEDYAAYASMTFGIENGNTYTKIFQDYALLHGCADASHERLRCRACHPPQHALAGGKHPHLCNDSQCLCGRHCQLP